MTQMKLDAIRIDGDTQARSELDQQHLSNITESMREGVIFPAVVVYFDGSHYWLSDGFHRYFATKANGHTAIDVEIRNGTVRDAQEHAMAANTKRGLAMTPEDSRMNCRKMLLDPEWSKWANTAIAKHLGVSSMTVGRVKATLEKTDDESTIKKFIHRSGNETTMDVGNIINKTHKIEKPDVSTAPTEMEQKVSELSDQLNELGDTVNTLSDENSLLRDKIAIGQWNASEIEKIDIEDTVAALREQVRLLEIDNKALRDSRDMYQSRNAELMALVTKLQKPKK